jgi:hypothetical protein
VSADLDALDRGVIETGQLAAEAIARICELEKRVKALEAQTPQAQRLQYEADVAAADAAEYDRHGPGCGCPYCYVPEVDT